MVARREKGSITGATLNPTRAADSTGPPFRVVNPEDEHAPEPDVPNAAGPRVTVISPLLPTGEKTAGYSHAANSGIEHVETPAAASCCAVALEPRVHFDAVVPKATKSKLAAPSILAWYHCAVIDGLGSLAAAGNVKRMSRRSSPDMATRLM